MRRIALAATFFLLVTACRSTTPVASEPVDGGPGSGSQTATTAPQGSPPCASGDLAFSGTGLVVPLGADRGDAATVSGVRWEQHDGCERIVVELLAAGDAPASTLGPAGASMIAGAPIVRLTLPDQVSRSGLAHTLIDGVFVERVYVAREPGAHLFIDLHLSPDVALALRVFDTSSPALVVVDVTSGEGDASDLTPAAVSDEVVVIEPQPGRADYPIRVTGYAAPGIGAVRVRLISDGAVVLDRSVATTGDPEVWQAFDIRLVDGPAGAVELFVGLLDASDLPVGGVDIALDLG